MINQLDLSFNRAGAEATAEEVDTLSTWLRGKGWVKAAAIEAVLAFDERKIRAIAEAADGAIISGPGCPGYRHIEGATLADIDRASSRLESQAKRMMRRALAYRRRAHQLIAR
jgi:hypothetical protein